MADTFTYKVKKGDSLPKIATQFGVKKWDTIWNAKENKSLVAKRKKPDGIQPGDEIAIPNIGKLGGNSQQKLDNLKVILKCQVENLEEQLDEVNANLESQVKTDSIITKLMEDDEKDLKNNMKLLDDATDLALTFVKTIGKSAKVLKEVGELTDRKARSSMKKIKTALTNVESMVKKSTKEDARDKISEKAKNLVKDQKDSTNEIISTLGNIVDWTEKLTKPSYLAGVYSQLKDGKKFSKAIATDVLEEMDNYSKDVQSSSKKALQQIRTHQTDLKAQLKEAKKIMDLID